VRHFEAAFAGLPETARHLRKRHFDTFASQGLPSKSEEDWRYTDLAGLADRALSLAGAEHPSLPDLPDVETLAFANGRIVAGDPTLARVAIPDMSPGPVRALNAAFSLAGLTLEVAPSTARPPLHLVTWFGGTPDGMAHLRHRIYLAPNASAKIVVHELGDDAPFFATQVFDLELAENSQLELYRVQQFGRGTSALTRVDARLARDARLTVVGLHAGGALVRNDVNIGLDAPGAQAELHGVLAPAPGEHLDVHTRMDHRAPQGRSRETFRCLVPHKARAIFNGKVIVHPEAQKTDSEQHVDSLLLSAGAEVNAKPELEIYADDVKCAHGATCGQLDEDAIYYLRTRGLDLPTARNLLLYTFAHEVLQRITFEPARALAERVLGERL